MKKIAISGLGKMGMQIVRKLVEGGFEVIAHDINKEAIDEATSYNAKPAYTNEDVVKAFNGEQLIIWIMVPSDVVDSTLDAWLRLVPRGSIITDKEHTAKKVSIGGQKLRVLHWKTGILENDGSDGDEGSDILIETGL
jgi:6-phosphogluconate dehydrogenase